MPSIAKKTVNGRIYSFNALLITSLTKGSLQKAENTVNKTNVPFLTLKLPETITQRLEKVGTCPALRLKIGYMDVVILFESVKTSCDLKLLEIFFKNNLIISSSTL